MWFDLLGFKARRENEELRHEVLDLTTKLIQTEQFERIASEKLRFWVTKHDDLLVKYKTLLHDESIADTQS